MEIYTQPTPEDLERERQMLLELDREACGDCSAGDPCERHRGYAEPEPGTEAHDAWSQLQGSGHQAF